MLPMMWSQPPCMNIEVKIVTQNGGSSRSTTSTPGLSSARRRLSVPSQTIGSEPGSAPAVAVTTPQPFPG